MGNASYSKPASFEDLANQAEDMAPTQSEKVEPNEEPMVLPTRKWWQFWKKKERITLYD